MHRIGGALCVAWLLWGNPDVARADSLRRASQAIHGDASNNQKPARVSERRDSRDRSREQRRERSYHRHHDHYDDGYDEMDEHERA
ncbi:MAG TPA: hypothetical protein VMF89_32460, partial [Polyangiales bacterium]|nr:hypothetical protein [Polyangiales bacterium]